MIRMDNEIKTFLEEKAMGSSIPISLKLVSRQFCKEQLGHHGQREVEDKMTELLARLHTWDLHSEDKIKIAYVYRTQISDEMEKERIVSCESFLLFLTSRPTRGQKRRLLIPEDIDPNDAFLNCAAVPREFRGYYIQCVRDRRDHGNVNLQGGQLTGQHEHIAQRNEEQNDVVEAAEEHQGQERQQTPQPVAMNAAVIESGDGTQHDVDPLAIQDEMPETHQQILENCEKDLQIQDQQNQQNNQNGKELSNPRAVPQAPPEPRIKIESADNDIMIVEVPIYPKVSKMAQGVANLADAYKLKDIQERALRIAKLPKSFHTKLETIELDFFVGGTINWAQRMKSSTFTENSVPLRQFYTDCKCHMLREVGYEFMEGEKGVLNELDAKICELEEVYELEEGDKLFISKDLIKEYIASFLLKQLEQKTHGI
ncbi:unnamed protein product [Caenorhabditis nigoni]